jgi:serine-type D-Ala-D-Ala carboxypeptidase (penicillin-binding protein 5/6)
MCISLASAGRFRVSLARLLHAGFLCLAGLSPSLAQTTDRGSSFETSAKQALLLDVETRTILFERNADQSIHPASLAKLMTAALAFREVKEGRLRPMQDMVASTDAWRRGGAVAGGPNMLITPNKVVKVGDLLTGLVVGSANDAAIVLAENIAGTEARFTEAMNIHAREIGLKNTLFANATGLGPGENQRTTLRDMVGLAAYLIATYPESYPLFSQRDMPFGRHRQQSRNPLLTMEIGADGLLTGTTPEGTHQLVGSAVQEGRRIIVAVAGLESVQERALEARKLIEWGFRRFELRALFPAGTRVGEASVYGGASGFVPLKVVEDLRLPVLRASQNQASLRVAYRGPVRAPIAEGQTIATLEILVENRVIRTVPLAAAEAVPLGSVFARAQDAALELSRQGLLNGFRWLGATIGFGTRVPPKEDPAAKPQARAG